MKYSDEKINQLLEGIFSGAISPEALPEDLYVATNNFLTNGLYKGYGGTLEDFTGGELELLEDLSINVASFAAAKTYTQVSEISSVLYDGATKRARDDFFNIARGIFVRYNGDWGEAEERLAIASGQSAVRWQQITEQADDLPYLTMSVVEDANTTEICAPLNGITLRIDDPFWKQYYPPNHWNCRSLVKQTSDGSRLSSPAAVKVAEKHADAHGMQDIFKMNVAMDRVVYSPEHNYFKNAPPELGRQNFGLPMPSKN